MFIALLTLCLYSINDITSKLYYTSAISFLLHGFITLVHCVSCDKTLKLLIVLKQNPELKYAIFYYTCICLLILKDESSIPYMNDIFEFLTLHIVGE